MKTINSEMERRRAYQRDIDLHNLRGWLWCVFPAVTLAIFIVVTR